LVIEEFNQSESDAFQVKSYAPGVGNVHVGWRGEDASHEILELVERVRLSSKALAEIRASALALEAHAHEISKEVYDQTSPSE
jgi:copper oxidase (laccase) domain-containing protein